MPFWSQHISFLFVGIIIAASIRGFLNQLMKVRSLSCLGPCCWLLVGPRWDDHYKRCLCSLIAVGAPTAVLRLLEQRHVEQHRPAPGPFDGHVLRVVRSPPPNEFAPSVQVHAQAGSLCACAVVRVRLCVCCAIVCVCVWWCILTLRPTRNTQRGHHTGAGRYSVQLLPSVVRLHIHPVGSRHRLLPLPRRPSLALQDHQHRLSTTTFPFAAPPEKKEIKNVK